MVGAYTEKPFVRIMYIDVNDRSIKNGGGRTRRWVLTRDTITEATAVSEATHTVSKARKVSKATIISRLSAHGCLKYPGKKNGGGRLHR